MRRLLVASSLLIVAAVVAPRLAGRGAPEVPAGGGAGPAPRAWTAVWVSAAGASPFDFGVYHFRRALDLPQQPGRFVVHVSADNRYQLFVNGTRVVWGPARGHLSAWPYETVDLAPWLRQGRNVLAAVVWNFGEHAPLAQHTWQTGFLLQGDTDAESLANTSAEWVATANEAYTPLAITYAMVRGYWAAGPGEQVDGAKYPWGWEQPDFDASSWKPAVAGNPARPREARDAHSRLMLVPRAIPLMEERPERLARVRKAEGLTVPAAVPAVPATWTVEPRRTVRLLLDRNELTTAYPELEVSGGAGATIGLRYAEALFSGPTGTAKGHRDEIEGKVFDGCGDRFLPDGGPHRVFRPLWWRTFRFLELTIETRDAPLTVHDIRPVYTGYPFERTARLTVPGDGARDSEIGRMLDVGWHTARLCAHETYMDCPYYEQLQYAGDTRVQALVSYYMSGDGRLARQAIAALDASRTYEGLTFSRAPSRLPQYIPPFSLWWIGMVHDFWRYQDDPAFVRAQLPGVRAVLGYFAARQRQDGLLAEVGWWNYVDWVGAWPHGVPPTGARGESALLDLQLLLAYQWAAELEAALGTAAQGDLYRAAAARLAVTIRETYWQPSRRLFADVADGSKLSQHAQALAIIAGIVDPAEVRPLAERMLTEPGLAPASIYFRYYVHRAVVEAGLGDRYVELLGPWREMLALGLTTWAERSEPTRSDAHAWGSSPNVEFLRTVLGVDSAGPGFSPVRVRPHLGTLAAVAGRVPHPRGFVEVSLKREGDALTAEITLPAGVTGELAWRGRSWPLRAGPQLVTAAR
jgi:hypothetical protein